MGKGLVKHDQFVFFFPKSEALQWSIFSSRRCMARSSVMKRRDTPKAHGTTSQGIENVTLLPEKIRENHGKTLEKLLILLVNHPGPH